MSKTQTPDWRDLEVTNEDLIAHELYTEQLEPVYGPMSNPRRIVTFFSIPDGYDYSWHDDAACKGIDSKLMMPERGEHLAAEKAKQKACGGCAVKAECLDFALNIMPSAKGIWGGTSEEERLIIRREKKKTRKVA